VMLYLHHEERARQAWGGLWLIASKEVEEVGECPQRS